MRWAVGRRQKAEGAVDETPETALLSAALGVWAGGWAWAAPGEVVAGAGAAVAASMANVCPAAAPPEFPAAPLA